MQERFGAHDHVAAEHRELAQLRTRLDFGVVPDVEGAFEDRFRVDFGAFRHPDAGGHFKAVDFDVDFAGEHVGLGAQVAFVGAHVLPVAVGDVAVERGAGFEEFREDVAGPVDVLAGCDMVQDLGLHDVDAGVDGVGEHLAPGGFLQEPLDAPVVVDDDDAELEGVGDPFETDGHQGTVLPVEPDHVGQVDVGERVTGDDDERLAPQVLFGVLDTARGPERHFFGDVAQAHAEFFTVAEVVADQGGEELHGDDRVLKPVSLQQPEHVLHDRPVDHGK